jgi:hypothetical protein
MDAVRMLRIIRTRRVYKIGDKLCGCLIDWEKIYDYVKLTKTMQILNETGIVWRGKRLTRKMYTDQCVKSTTRSRIDKKCEVWKRG